MAPASHKMGYAKVAMSNEVTRVLLSGCCDALVVSAPIMLRASLVRKTGS